MCKQLEVTRAAYYKWLNRKPTEQEKENIRLAELIREYAHKAYECEKRNHRIEDVQQKLYDAFVRCSK